MSVDTLNLLSLISYIAAGAFLVLTIVLFFALDIRRIIGDLSGKNARKAIEAIRRQNEAIGNQGNTAPITGAVKATTADISGSGRLIRKKRVVNPIGTTEKFATESLRPKMEPVEVTDADTILLTNAPETTVLSETAETTILSEAGETTLLSGAGETTLLSEVGETTILGEAGETTVLSAQGETTVLTGDLSVVDPTILPGTHAAPQPIVVELEMGFAESVELIV